MQILNTQTKFINIIARITFIISVVFIVLCPNTIALGAVATGRAKAYEQTMPKLSICMLIKGERETIEPFFDKHAQSLKSALHQF